MSKLKAIRSKDTIVLALNGTTINIQKKMNPDIFEKIDQMMLKNQVNEIESQFLDIKKRIESFTKGSATIVNGKVMLKGDSVEMPEAIVKKLVELETNQDDFLPLLRFWRKLKENPSENSRKQLYTYMMANKMNITEQGDIVFEKGVRRKAGGAPDQLVDGHTGDVDYSIGKVVSMSREKVNDNPNETCSRGLHVAPPDYVRQFYKQDIIIECIVDPKDVVSVPVDYNQRKVRVCRLQVMGYAKKSVRTNQIVKLSDFLQEMPEHYKNAPEKQSTGQSTIGTNSTIAPFTVKGEFGKILIEITDAELEIKGMTGREIIDYVLNKTGFTILIQLKNKNGIIKKAVEVLNEYNLKNTRLMQEEVKELRVDTTMIDSMTAKEIISYVKETYGTDLSNISIKNKVKILKEARLIIEYNEAATDIQKTEDKFLEEENPVADIKGVSENIHTEVPIEAFPPTQAFVKEIVLSTKTRDELVMECKTRFNEKIGGILISDKKVMSRAIHLFETHGYITK